MSPCSSLKANSIACNHDSPVFSCITVVFVVASRQFQLLRVSACHAIFVLFHPVLLLCPSRLSSRPLHYSSSLKSLNRHWGNLMDFRRILISGRYNRNFVPVVCSVAIAHDGFWGAAVKSFRESDTTLIQCKQTNHYWINAFFWIRIVFFALCFTDHSFVLDPIFIAFCMECVCRRAVVTVLVGCFESATDLDHR